MHNDTGMPFDYDHAGVPYESNVTLECQMITIMQARASIFLVVCHTIIATRKCHTIIGTRECGMSLMPPERRMSMMTRERRMSIMTRECHMSIMTRECHMITIMQARASIFSVVCRQIPIRRGKKEQDDK